MALPFCRGVPLTLKALRPKDFLDNPQTLGEHLKKRRRELGLLQREAAERMDILTETYANWEKDKTTPVAAQFRPVVEFLGFDPTPAPRTLSERLQAKRRELGVTFSQVAQHLGWDEGSLTRYLNGEWRLRTASTIIESAVSMFDAVLWIGGHKIVSVIVEPVLSSERAAALEQVLSMNEKAEAEIRKLPRRPRR